jgi:hypothetical protein
VRLVLKKVWNIPFDTVFPHKIIHRKVELDIALVVDLPF